MTTDTALSPALSGRMQAVIITTYLQLIETNRQIGRDDLAETCQEHLDALRYGGVLDLSVLLREESPCSAG